MMTERLSTYLRIRYILDRVAAGTFLIVLSPVIVVVAVVVAATSGLPVFFRQERIGLHGEGFELLKFRTMIPGAQEVRAGYMDESMNLFTPAGKFLRRTSLDELPQLVNVARGQMALIGPRPTLRQQYERYTDRQRRRADVRPGITGLAQVTYRNNAPWSKRIEVDIDYIERVSLTLDLRILVRTVAVVLSGSGVRNDQRREDVDDLGS